MSDKKKEQEARKAQEPTTQGTSHFVYTAGGQLIPRGEESGEICPVCRHSANGPTYFCIERKTNQGVFLVCPNCGERKFGFFGETKLERDASQEVDAGLDADEGE